MFIFLLVFLLTSVIMVSPVEGNMYTAKVIRVVDGDTILVEDRVLHVFLKKAWVERNRTYIRLKGVDTPEIGSKAKCEAENFKGQQAKELIERVVSPGDSLELRNFDIDPFPNRLDASVYLSTGEELSSLLIDQGLGRFYDKKHKKSSWCD